MIPLDNASLLIICYVIAMFLADLCNISVCCDHSG